MNQTISNGVKILYIITQADGGGAQKYALELAKHFRGAIAAGDEAQKLFADAKNAGLEVYPLKHLKRNISLWHDLWAIWEIRKLIKTLQPDIVHLNSSKAGVLGSFAGLGLKAKIIFTAHGFVFNEPLAFWLKNFYLALEKIASSYRDYIICVSEADRQSALKHQLIDETKISVIHNGIPAINFLSKAEARGQLALSQATILLGSVANLYETKGLDILVDALSLLDARLKEKIHLLIIGEGKHREQLENKILEYELGKKITLIGHLPQAYKYLKALDIFILPSRKEGFPFTLLEAMQAGLPIVATKVGGIPEALEDAGLQVQPDNAQALADAISQLLNDANLAAQFAHRAKQRSDLFTQEKMLEKTKGVYEKILQTSK